MRVRPIRADSSASLPEHFQQAANEPHFAPRASPDGGWTDAAWLALAFALPLAAVDFFASPIAWLACRATGAALSVMLAAATAPRLSRRLLRSIGVESDPSRSL